MRMLVVAVVGLVFTGAWAADAGKPAAPASKSAPAAAPAAAAPAKPATSVAAPAKPAAASATPAISSTKPAAPSATLMAAGAAASSTVAAPAPAPAPVAAGGSSESKAEPYYSFGWTEGFTLPSVGDWFVGSTFGTGIGAKYTINPEHAILGMYDLQYRGPGLKSQEGREFSERTIDHNFLLEHKWTAMAQYDVRTKVTYLSQMRRSGSNEVFGKGLYDFRVYGGSVVQDFPLRPEIGMSVDVTYQYFSFPNYTDLLAEFQGSGLGAELSGGQQDYHNVLLKGSAAFGRYGSAWLGLSMQSYANQKVVASSGTYSNKGQFDWVFDVGSAWNVDLVKAAEGAGNVGLLTSNPGLRLQFKNSNQNYLYFKYFGALPVFKKDYYSFSLVQMDYPFKWVIGEKDGLQSALFFSPTWIFTIFGRREARDEEGDYMKGKEQWTNLLMLTPGWTFPAGRFGRMTLGYTFHMQNSNNKYEKFLPYNYSGHVLFSSFEVVY